MILALIGFPGTDKDALAASLAEAHPRCRVFNGATLRRADLHPEDIY